MKCTICSPEESRREICAVLRRDHRDLSEVATSVMYETFGLTPDGDERVDAMNLHRWADAFVDGIRLYVCHDDHEAYDRILEVAREQSAELTADEIIGSAVLSFMMLTVYCVGAMAKTNEHHVCVQAVENLADIATRYIQDLRSIVPKTP